MPVFRVERNKGYTVMSNYHLRDKSLSLKAKGLLLACGPPRQGGIRPGLNLPRTFSHAAGAEGGIVLTSNELWGHNSA